MCPCAHLLHLDAYFLFSIRFFVDHLFHPSHYNPHTPSIFLCGFYLHPESKFPLLSSLYSLTTQRLPLFFPWLFLFWQYDFILTSWLKLSTIIRLLLSDLSFFSVSLLWPLLIFFRYFVLSSKYSPPFLSVGVWCPKTEKSQGARFHIKMAQYFHIIYT